MLFLRYSLSHSIFVAVAVIASETLWPVADRVRADEVELRFMSFNIRYSYGGADEAIAANNWTDASQPRRERVLRVIRDNRPDVLGVQEARELQVNDLRKALPEFEYYGVGRDDGKTSGEYSAVFYRTDRLKRADAGTFWLSATPEKPGTSFYTVPDAVPRLASWVRLRDGQSGREFLVLNAHWDHISEEARQKSAGLMRERLAQLAAGIPAILMGDFNTPEDSSPLSELIGEDATTRQLVDTYRTIHPERIPNEATFHNWAGTVDGSRIDFILCTEEFRPVSAAIVRTSYDGFWPSDHYPVTATLLLEPGSAGR